MADFGLQSSLNGDKIINSWATSMINEYYHTSSDKSEEKSVDVQIHFDQKLLRFEVSGSPNSRSKVSDFIYRAIEDMKINYYNMTIDFSDITSLQNIMSDFHSIKSSHKSVAFIF